MLIVPVIEWFCDKLVELKTVSVVDLVVDASIMATAIVVLAILIAN
jgi:hypothetical protein